MYRKRKHQEAPRFISNRLPRQFARFKVRTKPSYVLLAPMAWACSQHVVVCFDRMYPRNQKAARSERMMTMRQMLGSGAVYHGGPVWDIGAARESSMQITSAARRKACNAVDSTRQDYKTSRPKIGGPPGSPLRTLPLQCDRCRPRRSRSHPGQR